MQCPECLSFNEESAVFCGQCGGALKGGGTSRGRRGVSMALVVLAGGAVLAALAWLARDRLENDAPARTARPNERESRERPATANVALPNGSSSEPSENPQTIPVGMVTIEDRWGHRIASFPSVVVSRSWLAMPRKRVLGGTLWRFRPDTEDESVIDAGMWPREELGLWLLEKGDEFTGPDLGAWNENQSLRWLALEGSNPAKPVTVGPVEEKGRFLVFAAPSLKRDGVFLQGSTVVGWTFGESLPGGWLWTGEAGTDLRHELWVGDFYTQTFAGGREERFAEALGRRGQSPSDRMSRMASAFLLAPRLDPEETPSYVSTPAVVRSLLETCQALAPVDPAGVANALEERVLRAAESPELCLVALEAHIAAFGPASATALARTILQDLVEPASEIAKHVETRLRQLYVDWLQLCLETGALQRGWAVLSEAQLRFAGDPAIHLRGVELSIAAGDWPEAERQLDGRRYPLHLADQVKVLRAEIAELKGQEGKIVIRFQPGSNIIPTEAVLNRRVTQRFLVDTGASLTTIPRRTQEQLGIAITENSPRRRVSTAGGEVIAYEVVLDSVELGGWTVHNLAALVLDLSNDQQTGLLGLNFLQHYRMDLKSHEGVLTLEPR